MNSSSSPSPSPPPVENSPSPYPSVHPQPESKEDCPNWAGEQLFKNLVRIQTTKVPYTHPDALQLLKAIEYAQEASCAVDQGVAKRYLERAMDRAKPFLN